MTQMEKYRTGFVPPLVFGTLVLLVTFATYSGVMNADFLMWDDDIAILGNHNLAKNNIWWMFSELDTTQRYNPLTFLTWSLIYHLAGFNPYWFHFVSVLYHAMSALCLYLSLRELIKISVRHGWLDGPRPLSLELAAACGALVWALHPLRVEVVALAATTTYCQSALFLMAALLCYLKAHQFAQSGSRRYMIFIGMSLLCYICSLLTYPLGITFFLVFFIVDLCLLRRVDFSDSKRRWLELRKVLLEKVIFALPAVTIAFTAFIIRHRPSMVWESPVSLADFGIMDRVMQALYILAYFLWKPFYPVKLSPLYMTLISFDPYSLPFVLSLLVIVAITAVCVLMWKRLPILMGFWLCYIVFQFPFLGFFEHPHFHSDRYSLLSSLVFSLLIAVLLIRVFKKFNVWSGSLCMLALLATLGWMSVNQVGVWRNSEVLFNHIFRHLGDNPYRIEILGRLVKHYQQTGETEKNIQTLERILIIKPASVLAHRQLAAIYTGTGRDAQALFHFKRILEVEPPNFTTLYDYGMALLKVGRKAEAADKFRQAELLKGPLGQ